MNTLPLDPARAASRARLAGVHATDRFLGIMGLSFSGAELGREAEEQARHLARQRMLATAPAQAEPPEDAAN